MRDKYLHLEHDGKLFLVNNNGEGPKRPTKGRFFSDNDRGWDIRLPTKSEVEKIGIKWDEKRRNTIIFEENTYEVIYATPLITWPSEWAWKDDIISDSGVHPLARESVYRTIHRLVAKVIIMNSKKKILMAKVKRGHFTGKWTLPGGYLDYGEHPRNGAIREVFEELGINIEIMDHLGETKISDHELEQNRLNDNVVAQKIFSSEGINFVSFTYLSKEIDDDVKFKLKVDEIESIDWFTKNEAISNAASWFDLDALEKLT